MNLNLRYKSNNEFQCCWSHYIFSCLGILTVRTDYNTTSKPTTTFGMGIFYKVNEWPTGNEPVFRSLVRPLWFISNSTQLALSIFSQRVRVLLCSRTWSFCALKRRTWADLEIPPLTSCLISVDKNAPLDFSVFICQLLCIPSIHLYILVCVWWN